jgi:very-short-patch-repair endonuclease
VQKISIESAPPLPKSLKEWVGEITPDSKPSALEKINRQNWYYDPKSEELEMGRNALLKEFNSGRASQFSFDVGNLLIDRGFQVLPEYPVIGYRIDLVIQGENARLAVECDGDQYHTLENWEADQIREQQLRRAGWVFWRVSGSAFYQYKEKALDSLWNKLDELGIKPLNS